MQGQLYVKFRISDGKNSERIWGNVIEKTADGFRVVIDNDPLSEGYFAGQVVEVPASDVLEKAVFGGDT